ncbi:ATP-binding protein [Streptomyces sp. NPDC049687]|uniref:ATP-binding protein n=1 Tax=Streptomyces sp. NPDC049687 TaxID=3365596 RepID=UPI00378C3A79
MSDTLAPFAGSVDGERHRRFGSHLARSRKRVFVGRREELALFRTAIRDGGQAAVLYVHGPGGVGKSTLLRRFADEAVNSGRHVIEVDGRTTEPSPGSFQAVVGRVPDGSVLLIDTFERCQGLEEWLRERFLPVLPHDTTVVVAGREAPSTDWYIDPAWDETLHVLPLGDLTDDDALDLVRARGVPPRLHERVTAFAGRYPLALSLTATVVARRMPSSTDWSPTPNIVKTLLRHLVGSTPSPMHRHALEVCAHAMTTTEDLLRSVFGEEHAAELFDWLRGLPFVESGPGGIFPHDVVREALDSDLRWRDFAGYQKMHVQVREYAVEQVRRASVSSVLMAARAANYLLHHGPFTLAYHSWRGNGEVYEAPCRPQDRSTVLEMARQVLGGDSPAAVEYWLDRQPQAFRLYRSSATGTLLGFLAHLECERFTAEDATADPVVAALLRHYGGDMSTPADGVLRLARYLVQAEGGERPSPAFDLMRLSVLADLLRMGRLAWSGRVLSDREFWEKEMSLLGHETVDAGRTPDGRSHTVFVMDWQARPVEAWLDHLSRHVLFGSDAEAATTHAAPHSEPAPEPTGGELTDDQWDKAVRDLFRAWNHEDVLAANPITRLVSGGTPAERVHALRQQLLHVVESLRSDLTTAKYHHALIATYLGRQTTQRGAAARLGTPFSTYRRHLDHGLSEAVTRLRRQLTSQ